MERITRYPMAYEFKLKVSKETCEKSVMDEIGFGDDLRIKRDLKSAEIETIGDLIDKWNNLPKLIKKMQALGAGTLKKLRACAYTYFEDNGYVQDANIKIYKFKEEN